MSAAILYHVQGIRKYSLRKISIKKDIFIFECFWRHPEELKCAGCRKSRLNALLRTCRRRIRKRSERIFRILYLSATDFISCGCCIGRSRTVDARSIANYRTKPPAEPLREADLFC